MNTEDKIDKLLADVASIKVTIRHQSEDFKELKKDLKPVFDHVTGSKWMMKLGGGIVAVLTAVAGILVALR